MATEHGPVHHERSQAPTRGEHRVFDERSPSMSRLEGWHRAPAWHWRNRVQSNNPLHLQQRPGTLSSRCCPRRGATAGHRSGAISVGSGLRHDEQQPSLQPRLATSARGRASRSRVARGAPSIRLRRAADGTHQSSMQPREERTALVGQQPAERKAERRARASEKLRLACAQDAAISGRVHESTGGRAAPPARSAVTREASSRDQRLCEREHRVEPAPPVSQRDSANSKQPRSAAACAQDAAISGHTCESTGGRAFKQWRSATSMNPSDQLSKPERSARTDAATAISC